MTTVDDARAFLGEHHHAILITRRRDGRPQASPVAAAVDADGQVVISSRETAVKTKNVNRDPRVSVLVLSDGFYGPWVQVDGTAEIVHLPDAMDGLVDYYRRVAGEHDDWDEYRSAMHDEQRVLLRVSITDAGPNVAG